MSDYQDPVVISAYSDTDTTIIENPFPDRLNYDLKGWNQLSSISEAELKPGDKKTFQTDTDLYGVWKLSEIQRYYVTYQQPANGTLSVKSGSDTVPTGSLITAGTVIHVTAQPFAGYRLIHLRANDIEITNGAAFTVIENVSFEAEFAREYKIEWETPTGGTLRVTYKYGDNWVQLASGDKLLENTQISPVAQASEGYDFESMTINGVECASGIVYNLVSDVAITASFVPTAVTQYKVTISPMTGGQVYITDQYGDEIEDGAFVDEGTILTIQASANTGHAFSSMTVNGIEIANPASFELTEDITVNATFSTNIYTVTVAQPSNGTITIKHNDTIVISGSAWEYGTVFTYSISPSSGYSGQVTINGVQVGTSGQYTLTGQTAFGGYTYAPITYKYVELTDTAGNVRYYTSNQIGTAIQFTDSNGSIHSPFSLYFTSRDQLSRVDDQTSYMKYINSCAFYSCQNLTYASFPACKDIGADAFANCSNLKTIIAPNVLKLNEGAFSACKELQTADFPECSCAGNIFAGCVGLQTINLPKCHVGALTFDGVGENLKSLTLGAGGEFGPSDIKFAYPLTNIVYASISHVSKIASSVFSQATSMQTLYAPECTTIGANALAGCTNMQNLTLNVSGTLGKSIAGLTLSSCKSLTTVSFQNITSIAVDVFRGCHNLTTAYFPRCKTITGSWSTTSIYGAFAACRSITSIDLPSCTDIGAMTFYYCEKLSQISLPACVTLRSQAFWQCSALTSISLPACTTIQGGGNSDVFGDLTNGVFEECSRLTTIYAPVCGTIGNGAFACGTRAGLLGNRGKNPLTSLTIGFTGTFTIETIYSWFRCIHYSLSYPEHVIGLQYLSASKAAAVGSSAFLSVSSLKEIWLNSCHSIYQSAFYGCSNLSKIYLLSTAAGTLQNSNAFEGCASNYKIYVPSSLYATYIAKAQWSAISSHITSEI